MHKVFNQKNVATFTMNAASIRLSNSVFFTLISLSYDIHFYRLLKFDNSNKLALTLPRQKYILNRPGESVEYPNFIMTSEKPSHWEKAGTLTQ